MAASEDGSTDDSTATADPSTDASRAVVEDISRQYFEQYEDEFPDRTYEPGDEYTLKETEGGFEGVPTDRFVSDLRKRREQQAKQARIDRAKQRIRERFKDRKVDRIAPGTTDAGDVYATVVFEGGETQFVDDIVSGGAGPEGTQVFRQTQDDPLLDTEQDVVDFLTGRGIERESIVVTEVGGQPGAIIDASEFEGESEPDYFRNVSAGGQFDIRRATEEDVASVRLTREELAERVAKDAGPDYSRSDVVYRERDGQTVAVIGEEALEREAEEDIAGQYDETYGDIFGDRTYERGDEFLLEKTEEGYTGVPTASFESELQEYGREAAAAEIGQQYAETYEDDFPDRTYEPGDEFLLEKTDEGYTGVPTASFESELERLGRQRTRETVAEKAGEDYTTSDVVFRDRFEDATDVFKAVQSGEEVPTAFDVAGDEGVDREDVLALANDPKLFEQAVTEAGDPQVATIGDEALRREAAEDVGEQLRGQFDQAELPQGIGRFLTNDRRAQANRRLQELLTDREFDVGDEFTLDRTDEGFTGDVTDSFRRDIQRAQLAVFGIQNLREEFAQVRDVYEAQEGPLTIGEDVVVRGEGEDMQILLGEELVSQTSGISPEEGELTPYNEYLQTRAETEAAGERRRQLREAKAEIAKDEGIDFDQVSFERDEFGRLMRDDEGDLVYAGSTVAAISRADARAEGVDLTAGVGDVQVSGPAAESAGETVEVGDAGQFEVSDPATDQPVSAIDVGSITARADAGTVEASAPEAGARSPYVRGARAETVEAGEPGPDRPGTGTAPTVEDVADAVGEAADDVINTELTEDSGPTPATRRTKASEELWSLSAEEVENLTEATDTGGLLAETEEEQADQTAGAETELQELRAAARETFVPTEEELKESAGDLKRRYDYEDEVERFVRSAKDYIPEGAAGETLLAREARETIDENAAVAGGLARLPGDAAALVPAGALLAESSIEAAQSVERGEVTAGEVGAAVAGASGLAGRKMGEEFEEDPLSFGGQVAGGFLVGAAGFKALEKAGDVASSARVLRKSETKVDIDELRDPDRVGQTSGSEYPEFSQEAVRDTREALEEFRAAAGEAPEEVKEAVGSERILYHGTQQDFPDAGEVTAGSRSELSGQYVSADPSDLRLRSASGGGLSPSSFRFIPSVRDKRKLVVRGADEGEIRAVPDELGGSRVPGEDLDRPVYDWLGRKTGRERGRVSEYMIEEGGEGEAFVLPRGTRTSEQEALVPEGTPFEEVGTTVAVRVGRGDYIEGRVFRYGDPDADVDADVPGQRSAATADAPDDMVVRMPESRLDQPSGAGAGGVYGGGGAAGSGPTSRPDADLDFVATAPSQPSRGADSETTAPVSDADDPLSMAPDEDTGVPTRDGSAGSTPPSPIVPISEPVSEPTGVSDPVGTTGPVSEPVRTTGPVSEPLSVTEPVSVADPTYPTAESTGQPTTSITSRVVDRGGYSESSGLSIGSGSGGSGGGSGGGYGGDYGLSYGGSGGGSGGGSSGASSGQYSLSGASSGGSAFEFAGYAPPTFTTREREPDRTPDDLAPVDDFETETAAARTPYASGWFNELVVATALGPGPREAPSQEELADVGGAAALTGLLPTQTELSGTEEEQEAIAAVEEFYLVGGGDEEAPLL